MTRKLLFTVLLTLLMASLVTAQSSSGQLCIRAFEDRNGNAVQDANEPPIVRGLSATLADATSLIVATNLMESSSSASSGTLCFQQLAEGQYTIRVSSADYIATTPGDFTAAVSEGGIPQVLSFGGQYIPVELPDTGETVSQQARLQEAIVKAVAGLIGALLVMGAMAVVGAIIYFAVLRNRRRPAPTGAYRPVPGTGQYQPVPGSGQYQPVPDTGSYPASDTPPHGSAPAIDDTDTPGVVTVEDSYDMYSDDEDEDTNKPVQRIHNNPYAEIPDDDFEFEDDDANYRPPEE